MIQRIQTVYFLISELLIGALFFVPFAKIAGTGSNIYRFDMKGLYLEGIQKPESIISGLPLIVICSLSLLIIIPTIFMYKYRKVQIRLATINIFFLLGLFGLMLYAVLWGAKNVSGTYSLHLYFIFPIIAVVLNFLAIKAIQQDEMLVSDRIR